MKQYRIKIIAFILCVSIFSTGILAAAYSRYFAYDFSHHIEGYVYYASKDKCKPSVDVASWGSSSFYIKQVKWHVFSTTTVTSKTFYKSNGNKQSKTFNQEIGRPYQYQFWKAQDEKRIIGTGKIDW